MIKLTASRIIDTATGRESFRKVLDYAEMGDMCWNCKAYEVAVDTAFGPVCFNCEVELFKLGSEVETPVSGESITTPNNMTATTGRKGSKMHATVSSEINAPTVCGKATPGMYQGGYHDGETVVTCGNCVRILRKAPVIKIEIEVHEYSTDAEDHSECLHREDVHEGCSDCLLTDEPGCETCMAGDCECESIGDEECDNVGGRSLEGDHRTIREHAEVFPFERDVWRDAVNMPELTTMSDVYAVYVDAVIGSVLSPYRYLTWTNERTDAQAHECSDTDGGTHTDYTLTVSGPGVTDTVREMVLRTLASR